MATPHPVELLLLVPGAGRAAQGWQRERFVTGLTAAAEGRLVERVEGAPSPAHAIRLKVMTPDQEERFIDVVETYWNDLMPSLAQADASVKFARGTSLILYWVFSGIWRGFFGRKYLTAGMVASALALVSWYYGTAALFVQAVRTSSNAPDIVRNAAAWLGQWFDLVAGWEVWAVATLVMGLIPVNVLVETMDFSKRFLSNERTGDGSVGLRVQVRKRVAEQVSAALDAAAYHKLIVVGHSFGCLVALDLLADLPLPAGTAVRFVTIGSSIELVSRKDEWPVNEVEKCGRRPEVHAWVDVVSERDWFASGTPPPPDASKFSTRMIAARGTLVDALMFRTHGMYFDADETVQAVLG